ncbi:MAG: DegT/DnrJ/EryC1/StrS family aminotransferase [Acidipila sp.]|nr:DegT/DnrJ/EryC1/StrS family aminotransferase [Acidipila sp.]
MTQVLTERPAIVGGKPFFAERLPIVSPEGLPGESFVEAVRQVLSSRMLTNGARVRDFEEAASAYLGTPHCVAVSSCTSGLLLALRALELSGEVILPSFTFYATAHSVLWNGLKPVFADCDPDTFCISPADVSNKLTSRTAAILAVHMYGHPADVEALQKIAGERGIPLIFDAAHAFGSKFNGQRVGGFGTSEVFSFSPTKLLVAAEGGLVTTRDGALARKLRAGRNYGDAGNYDPEMAGLNARMSEIHAALARLGLDGIDDRIARRNEIRLRYESRLGDLPGIKFQQIRPGYSTTCKDFSVLVDEAEFGAPRDWLYEALTLENIQVRRYFWPPVHRQKLYRTLWDGSPLPVTDHVSGRILSLPIYSSLSDATVDKVSDAIARLHAYVLRGAIRMEQSA